MIPPELVTFVARWNDPSVRNHDYSRLALAGYIALGWETDERMR